MSHVQMSVRTVQYTTIAIYIVSQHDDDNRNKNNFVKILWLKLLSTVQHFVKKIYISIWLVYHISWTHIMTHVLILEVTVQNAIKIIHIKYQICYYDCIKNLL